MVHTRSSTPPPSSQAKRGLCSFQPFDEVVLDCAAICTLISPAILRPYPDQNPPIERGAAGTEALQPVNLPQSLQWIAECKHFPRHGAYVAMYGRIALVLAWLTLNKPIPYVLPKSLGHSNQEDGRGNDARPVL